MAPELIGLPYDAEAIKTLHKGIGEMPADMFSGTDEELNQLAEFIVATNSDGEGSEGESSGSESSNEGEDSSE